MSSAMTADLGTVTDAEPHRASHPFLVQDRLPTAMSAIRAELLDQAWEVAPRLIPEAWPETDALLDRRAVEWLILNDQSVQSGTSLITDGIARPLSSPDAMERLDVAARSYADGQVLVLVRVEARMAKLAALCRDIDLMLLRGGMALSEATSANVYLGPPDTCGFKFHYDDHCALIIQLDGTKHWAIYPPADPLPTIRCDRPIDPTTLGEPCLEVTLHPGSILYVPRGSVHAARSGKTGSLHVTLAMRTVRCSDLLEDIEDIQSSPASRRSARCHAGCFSPSSFAQVLPSLKGRIASSLSALTPVAAQRFAAIDRLDALCPETLLTLPEGVMLLHCDDGEETLLHYPGGALRLPIVMASVFRFLATHDRFILRDLPDCAAAYDKHGLVSALVRRGLLCPVPRS